MRCWLAWWGRENLREFRVCSVGFYFILKRHYVPVCRLGLVLGLLALERGRTAPVNVPSTHGEALGFNPTPRSWVRRSGFESGFCSTQPVRGSSLPAFSKASRIDTCRAQGIPCSMRISFGGPAISRTRLCGLPKSAESKTPNATRSSEKKVGVRKITTRRDARSVASFSFSPMVAAGSW